MHQELLVAFLFTLYMFISVFDRGTLVEYMSLTVCQSFFVKNLSGNTAETLFIA